jgi:predicted Fe-Mo cluster-binding NifX family protein
MRIAVTSTADSKYALMDERFGRCAFFAIYDSKADHYEFLDNTAVAAGHGAGISAAQFVADQKIDVVITGNLGPKAKQVLDASNIKGFKLEAVKIEDAVKAFQAGEAVEIVSAGPSHKG